MVDFSGRWPASSHIRQIQRREGGRDRRGHALPHPLGSEAHHLRHSLHPQSRHCCHWKQRLAHFSIEENEEIYEEKMNTLTFCIPHPYPFLRRVEKKKKMVWIINYCECGIRAQESELFPCCNKFEAPSSLLKLHLQKLDNFVAF